MLKLCAFVLLTKAILEQMEKDGTEYVWEDLRDIPEEELESHFPNIVGYCLNHGYDVRKDCIPVVPAQHYFMGGIKVNDKSKTSMEALYAVGETACNGVHGRNRLASNSLLESLVFAKRAAMDITEHICETDLKETDEQETHWQDFLKKNNAFYQDGQALEAKYKDLVLDKIKKAKEER